MNPPLYEKSYATVSGLLCVNENHLHLTDLQFSLPVVGKPAGKT